MNDEELEKYLKIIEPKFNSHLEKGTIEMSIEYYNLLEERIRRLINRNEKLKEQFEESNQFKFTYNNDKTKVPAKIYNKNTIKDIKKLKQENAELKKQLEEANKKLYLCTPEIPQDIHEKYVSYVDLVEERYKIESQQQEFMSYLKVVKLASPSRAKRDIIDEILMKYKKIIGE